MSNADGKTHFADEQTLACLAELEGRIAAVTAELDAMQFHSDTANRVTSQSIAQLRAERDAAEAAYQRASESERVARKAHETALANISFRDKEWSKKCCRLDEENERLRDLMYEAAQLLGSGYHATDAGLSLSQRIRAALEEER